MPLFFIQSHYFGKRYIAIQEYAVRICSTYVYTTGPQLEGLITDLNKFRTIPITEECNVKHEDSGKYDVGTSTASLQLVLPVQFKSAIEHVLGGHDHSSKLPTESDSTMWVL